MVKVVFIDIDNTLLDFILCSKASIKACFAEFSLPYTESVYDVFASVNTPLWESLERGEITRENIFRTRWGIIFEKLGLSCDPHAMEARFLSALSSAAEPVEGAMELLSYLHKKYTVCAASNAMYDHQRSRLSLAGMLPYIDHLFVSERIGAEKPSAAFLETCLSSLPEIERNECIVLGDSLSADIAGGVNAGIPTIWFNHDRIPVPQSCAATHIVDSLSEVKAIL